MSWQSRPCSDDWEESRRWNDHCGNDDARNSRSSTSARTSSSSGNDNWRHRRSRSPSRWGDSKKGDDSTSWRSARDRAGQVDTHKGDNSSSWRSHRAGQNGSNWRSDSQKGDNSSSWRSASDRADENGSNCRSDSQKGESSSSWRSPSDRDDHGRRDSHDERHTSWQKKPSDGWTSKRDRRQDSGWQDKQWKKERAPKEPPIGAELLEKIRARLAHVTPGSYIAVVSLQGSFCPITLSHIMCCVEARKTILSSSGKSGKAGEIENLETFSDVIGFVGCNSDNHVGRKLSRMDPPEALIPFESRRMLVELATQDYDWLYSVAQAFDAVEELREMSEFNELHIKHFEVVGADTACHSKPWRRVNDKDRLIIMGRAADPDADNGTDAVHQHMKKDGNDCISTPLCILGPEMPVVSSTAARKALRAADTKTLAAFLHPAVQDWNLREGPYAPASVRDN